MKVDKNNIGNDWVWNILSFLMLLGAVHIIVYTVQFVIWLINKF